MARHSLRVNGVGSGPDSIILCQEVAPDGFATTAVVRLYQARCAFYGTDPNSGVLTALRHGLRELRVAGGFTDHDMLPLADLLLCGGPADPSDQASEALFQEWCAAAQCTRPQVSSVVRRFTRLDFTRAMHRWGNRPRSGLRSHGAVSLAKVLERNATVNEVRLDRNKIGAYGAAALGRALAHTSKHGVKVLRLRGCSIGEQGARALAEHLICPGIDLAQEFASRTLLDYPDPLGPSLPGLAVGCPCCAVPDPLRSPLGGASAPLFATMDSAITYVNSSASSLHAKFEGYVSQHEYANTMGSAWTSSKGSLMSDGSSSGGGSGGDGSSSTNSSSSSSGGSDQKKKKSSREKRLQEEAVSAGGGGVSHSVEPTSTRAAAPPLPSESKQGVRSKLSLPFLRPAGSSPAKSSAAVVGAPTTQSSTTGGPTLPSSSSSSAAEPLHALRIDLSANALGWQGLCIVSLAQELRSKQGLPNILLDVDANSILAEVMNSVTHGFGVLLCALGMSALCGKAAAQGRFYVPVAVYSASLLVLYSASTLFHSCFLFPKRVLEWLHFVDKAGIYLLIAGSYTPFLVILFPDKPAWSVWLLTLVWVVATVGILVAAILPPSKLKARISLSLYLVMGWGALIIYSDIRAALPSGAIYLLMAGGFAYTSGVPLFVRNKNLDHAIWHMFVLAGSALHWICIYVYLLDPATISVAAAAATAAATAATTAGGGGGSDVQSVNVCAAQCSR